MGRGGGLVVSVLTCYSEGSSSKHFSRKILF